MSVTSSSPKPAPRDLRQYLDILRQERLVVEVTAPVDPDLEIAEVHRRVIAAGGPALLFSNVKGSKFPVVTNLFGTARRMELAFGSRPRALVEHAARLPEELMPPSIGKLWAQRSFLWTMTKVGTRRGSRAHVAEVVEDPPRVLAMPALKTWPRDGGRFITLPLVYTQHPTTHVPNLGMYRMQLFDDATCGMHMQIGKGGGFHLAEAEARGNALPVNVFVGGPPALMLGAIAPFPENVPELLLTSLVLGERLRLADNPKGPLPLVADAEFALVGEIPARVRRPEGPFGDHYGYYSETHDYPQLNVRASMHRRDAIWPATVVGKPRQEDFFIGDYLQDLLSPLFPVVMPSVLDLWSYGETGYHALSAAVVRERYRREAMMSAFRILGEGQLSLTKFLLLTNQPVDLHDFKATLAHVLARADFRTDLFVFANLSMDSLDYAGPKVNEGSKGVLLGTGDPIRKLPTEFSGTPRNDVRKVRMFCPGCLVIECARFADDTSAPSRIAQDPAFATWPLLVLTDDADRQVKSTMNFLWSTFTRFNPGSDIHANRTELIANHASLTPPIVIDARMKPWYPEELSCDVATAALVTKRWKEYFPAGMEMGDSEKGHLD